MTAVEGIRLDGLPSTPKIRKGMPNPFSRPSISVGGTGVRREWRTVNAADLQQGDTLPSVGLIASVEEDFAVQTAGVYAQSVDNTVTWTVTVSGGSGNQKTYWGGEPVLAFVAVEDTSDDGK